MPAQRPSRPEDMVPRGALRATWVGLLAERTVRAFWPMWSLLLAVFATVLLGVHESLPLEAVWGLGALAVGGLVWSAIFAARRFVWPDRAAALMRLDDTLPGQPIAALRDEQAIGTGDTASERVWRTHRARMQDRLAAAAAVRPDLRLTTRDRFGLRFVALSVFAVALVFGSFLRLDTVGTAVPSGASAGLAAGPSWEGWIEPPAYTGRPSLYLNDISAGAIEVPVGSRVDLRLYGEIGALGVIETVSGSAPDAPSTDTFRHAFEVAQAGRIEISGPGGAAWSIALARDTAPEIAFDGAIRRAAQGEMTQPFAASDDFGVVSGEVVIALDRDALDRRHGLATPPDPREPIVARLPLPIAGDRSEFTGDFVEDFSKHPWANLPVTMTLRAEDAAGNVGESAVLALDALPGRRFFDPLARAVIEQRRDLLWARANAEDVARMLRAMSHRPEDLFRSEPDYLKIRFIARELESARAAGVTEAQQSEIAEALWELALSIEEGDLSDAMARLRRAQDRLAEAMEEGASNEEIAELMQELREAMQDYMRQLAEQMQQGDQPQDLAEAQELSGQQLQDMLDRLQQLMEEGRMAEAQALLDQLNQMMQNMQMAQNQGQGQPSPGQEAMEGLQQTLRDQQNLSDDSFQGLQGQQPGEGQQGQGQQGQMGQGQPGQQGQGQGQGQMGQGQPGGQGQQPGAGADQPGLGEQLADRQRQLRRELERQREGLPGAGEGAESARRSLDEAGRAMDDAEGALRENDLAGAMENQSEAMDRLRDGIQSLGEDLAQQQQPGQGSEGTQMGSGGPNGQRDPLGRDPGGEGQLGTRDSLLQDEDVYERARDLLDEIRRRSGDQSRPAEELDYLERLLDRF